MVFLPPPPPFFFFCFSGLVSVVVFSFRGDFFFFFFHRQDASENIRVFAFFSVLFFFADFCHLFFHIHRVCNGRARGKTNPPKNGGRGGVNSRFISLFFLFVSLWFWFGFLI